MCFVGSLLETVRPKSPCLGPDLLVLTPLPVIFPGGLWLITKALEDFEPP